MNDNTVERRAVRRHKVLKGATISFDDSGVACVGRNLSTSGATLELASSVSLPTSFTLEIKADHFIRRRPAVDRASDPAIGSAGRVGFGSSWVFPFMGTSEQRIRVRAVPTKIALV